MCGICGIYSASNAPIPRSRVELMCDVMANRGPDGAGVQGGAGCLFGHRRLAIIDLTDAGRQPMFNEDGQILLTCNGEIYNYRDLRSELVEAGHGFKSNTDTEIIIHGYEEWGIETLLKRVRGMFAFALYDKRRGKIFLARDPLGKKPLFYQDTGKELIFASSARALSLGLNNVPEINPRAVDALLWNSYIPSPETIFLGVNKLSPAHYLEKSGELPATAKEYWRPNYFDKTYGIRPEEWMERVDAVLTTAVNRRLEADVPIGVMLSGGVDSGLITAMAAKKLRKVKTFCVANEIPSDDESAYALAVSKRYATDHTVLHLNHSMSNDLVAMVAAMGEPLADASAANMYAISKLARTHVKAALTGDGGDEAFGGYTETWAVYYSEKVNKLIPEFLSAFCSGATKLIPEHPSFIRRMGTFLKLSSTPLEDYFGHLHSDQLNLRSDLYTPEFINCLGSANPVQHSRDILSKNIGYSWPSRLMQWQASARLPDDYLVKIDFAAMGVGLEGRSPFLDQDVVMCAMSIPDREIFLNREPKGLLRELARKYLPTEGVNRRKQGFSAPIGLWFRRDWGKLAEELLLNGTLSRRGWFRQNVLKEILQSHEKGKDYSKLLWALLVLEIWLRIAVDKTLLPADTI